MMKRSHALKVLRFLTTRMSLRPGEHVDADELNDTIQFLKDAWQAKHTKQ